MKIVIVYDSDSLELHQYKVDNNIDTKNYDCVITNKHNKSIQYKVDYGLQLTLLKKDRKIELDPTTMEKIYRYNNKINQKELEDEIKKLKQEVNKLQKIKNAIEYLENSLVDFSKSSYDTFEEYDYNKYQDMLYAFDDFDD